ncbi:uncharacterized protein LOC133111947 isoform X2 [Conger conger]|uniref:uncharacterized protein LOC133111947 isoform X2 n=1 Tax=Conger conger TaxID=82655 RepID=UPI002A59D54F|nr:uncharacterized protein LOC133111947 isoform X2 [Conger conger]
MNIPVVDFDVYRVGVEDVAEEKLDVLCKELRSAFTEVGFVYLKNTGISQYEVDTMMNISKTFFLLPHEAKMPFLRGKHADPNQGWVSSGTERLNSRRACDLKEAFNTSSLLPSMKWPSEEVLPGFREKQVWFYRRCADLSLRVLRVLALSLGLDPDFFLSKHSRVVDGEQQAGGQRNGTTLRLLYYPPVQTECVQEGQVRCGEHSDFGTITLVFQGPGGGLQVLGRSGDFIAAPTIPGTVLVNIADLMQRWTSDVLISAVHRVLLPPPGDMSERQSVVFFLHPDDDAVITCCDGTDKYPAITALDYLMERLENSYRRK